MNFGQYRREALSANSLHEYVFHENFQDAWFAVVRTTFLLDNIVQSDNMDRVKIFSFYPQD